MYTFRNSIIEDKTPHVAKITIEGLIEENNELLDRIDKIDKDDSAKALIISISSPGGNAYAGETIFKAIQKVKRHKPVISEIRGVGASAAYMIACAGNSIIASDTSIVGSIGVLVEYTNYKHLFDKLGISHNSIKSSPLKGEPSPYSAENPEATKRIQEMVNDCYYWFVKIVSESRNIPYDKALSLSDGRIWIGYKAKKLGLVDIIGGRKEIWGKLRDLGLDKNVKIIRQWDPPQKYWFSGLKNHLTSALKDAIPFYKSTNTTVLLALWNPQDS
ncbi:signal peptide peptidase SppA [Candidatus Liberibacter africanus]|uniref:signal peptide peptidase SppA n=1 Tax=Liberibacter africanus TaxID=34020 RepID=UPI001FCD45AC|nr:signal peptide peptidase SppA [Candidatus Liberibacter africanus]